MTFSRDSEIIELWLEGQGSPHTRNCYRRDVSRLAEPVSPNWGDCLPFRRVNSSFPMRP